MTEYERRLLETLVNNLRALREDVHAIHENQQAEQRSRDDEPVQPLAIEIVRASEFDIARREYYESKNRERNSAWVWFKRIGETIGIVAAVALAFLTLLTFWEIHKQTPEIAKSADAARDAATLTRQVTQSTQAAIVMANCMPSIELNNSYTISCNLPNEGKAIAINAVGDFIIDLQFYPSHKSIKQSPLHLSRGQLGTVATGSHNIQGTVLVAGLDTKFISSGKRVVVVNGTTSYENGFGRIISDKYCWQDMQVAGINVGTSRNNYWMHGFIDCDKVSPNEARNSYYAEHDLKGK